MDHELDVIIGRNAAKNLRVCQDRQDYKRGVIAAHDTCGDYLSRQIDGDYFVMTDQERVAAKKARLVHQDATKRIQAWRASRRREATGREAAS